MSALYHSLSPLEPEHLTLWWHPLLSEDGASTVPLTVLILLKNRAGTSHFVLTATTAWEKCQYISLFSVCLCWQPLLHEKSASTSLFSLFVCADSRYCMRKVPVHLSFLCLFVLTAATAWEKCQYISLFSVCADSHCCLRTVPACLTLFVCRVVTTQCHYQYVLLCVNSNYCWTAG